MNLSLFLLVVGTSVLFAGAGLAYANRGGRAGPDAFVSARGEVGMAGAVGTLFASAMGPWILFGPPEAATWGGWPAVVGYGIGSVLPVWAFIPIGLRLRRRLPQGRTLSEYVHGRYGPTMHVIVLLVILFYLGVSLTAQLTGVGFLLARTAAVPVWLSVGTVLGASVLYTVVGGLRASIFTDGIQSVIIVPLLAGTAVYVSGAAGGVSEALGLATDVDPVLTRWDYGPGWRGGLALVLAISGASLFNQGTWQRVWAMESEETLTRSFGITAPLNGLVVAGLGVFGLVAVGLGRADPPSTALFNLLSPSADPWAATVIVVLAVALVTSSADTILSALTSLVVADLELLGVDGDPERHLRWARWGLLAASIPVFVVAARGYSVLYLFLIADLVCVAAAYPVFGGLFDERHGTRSAVGGSIAGLLVGGALFPGPATMSALLGAYAAALGVSVTVAVLLRAPAGACSEER